MLKGFADNILYGLIFIYFILETEPSSGMAQILVAVSFGSCWFCVVVEAAEQSGSGCTAVGRRLGLVVIKRCPTVSCWMLDCQRGYDEESWEYLSL